MPKAPWQRSPSLSLEIAKCQPNTLRGRGRISPPPGLARLGRACSPSPPSLSEKLIAYRNMLQHRLPVLVTGLAGVAGFNVFHALHRSYPGQVIGIRPRQTWKLNGPGIVVQDAEDAAGMRQLFERFGFRSVLN